MNKKVIFTALAVVMFAAGEVKAANVPPVSELTPYVTSVFPAANPPGTADLQAELEQKVQEFIGTPTWAPLFMGPSRGGGHLYFDDPAENLYSLSLAMPHLSPALQAQLKTYLDNYYLTQVKPSLSSGTRLDPFTGQDRDQWRRAEITTPNCNPNITPGFYQGPCQQPLAKSTSHTTMWVRRPAAARLYFVWGYAHFAQSWDVIQADYPAISILGRSLSSTVYADWRRTGNSANFNAEGLIGFYRIADHFAPTITQAANDKPWALTSAATALQARIQLENDFLLEGNVFPPNASPTIVPKDRWDYHWMGYPVPTQNLDRGWFIHGQGAHQNWLPRWTDLTSEIGQVLSRYAPQEMATQKRFVKIVLPLAHIAIAPNHWGGEAYTMGPVNSKAIFDSMAFIYQENGETLKNRYLSTAWVKADPYYIQKLSWTIGADGGPAGTPTPAPTPSGSPGFTVADLKLLLSRYLTGLDSQYFPVDGKVNILDAVYVMQGITP